MVTTLQSNGLDCAEDSTSGHDIFINLPKTKTYVKEEIVDHQSYTPPKDSKH
jgi:hypothetical protein